MLYYTFTKRWFTDAMNFADLPSLNEADTKVEGQFLPGKFLPKTSPKKVPPNSPLFIAQCVFLKIFITTLRCQINECTRLAFSYFFPPYLPFSTILAYYALLFQNLPYLGLLVYEIYPPCSLIWPYLFIWHLRVPHIGLEL